MKKKLFLFLTMAFLLLFSAATFAQSKTITGTVTDSSGNPINAASVKIKGTQRGTITNLQGAFTLQASPDNVLIISSLNYVTREVIVGGQSELNISLQGVNNQNLSDVVVTAFGVKKETRSLGYEVQTVSSEKLTQASNNSLAGALQGKATGITITPSSGMPGASAMIVMRGARSFTGDNTPLYVIDGMPVSSGADISTGDGVSGTDVANRAVDIDPNDIANIELLDGQKAAALYGIRASNGVIVITTKSGQGINGGRAKISFSTNASFDNLSRKPKFQTEYAQGSGGVYSPTASTSWGPKISDLPNDPKYGGNTQNSYTADGLHNGQYYVTQRAQAGLDPWATPGVYDNVGDFFNTGKTYNNYLSIANGNDNNSYALSLGSTNQTGIVPHTAMNRYTANLGATSKLSEHFKATFNGHFTNSDINKAPGANDGIMATVYNAPASYDLKGIPDHVDGDLYTPVNYRGGAFTNPYWNMEHNLHDEKTNRFFGNTNVTYSTRLNDAMTLDVKYQIGADVYTTNYTDLLDYGMPGAAGGSITQTTYTNSTFNSYLSANFKWDINKDLNLNVLLGNEYNSGSSEYRQQIGYSFAFSGFDHMDNTTTKDATEQYLRKRNFGTFGDISLSYLNMLYLDLTGRNDIVSTMPSNNRSFFYPSASLSFIFTELAGLKGNSVLNYGKVRVSYAQVGQAGDYFPPSYSIPGYGGGFYSFTPILYPVGGVKAYVPNATLYDPNLKPQNTNSIEAGTDLKFFNNLVELSYTYSHQHVVGQIFPVPLAGSTGASSLVTNGGAIHTNSHEVSLTVNAIRQKDIEWSIGANFTKIVNYVDELAPGVTSIFLGGFVTPQVRASIGYQFPTIYGVTYARNDQGKVIVGDDGVPESGAPGVIGQGAPKFTMGFNTNLRYKIFTLAAVLDWKNGGQMYSGTTGLFDNYGVSLASAAARDKNSVIFPNAVKEDGTPNDIAVTGTSNIQNYYSTINGIDESSIVKAGFLKLREVSLSVQALKKQHLSLDVNIFARNILLWTDSPYLDPESSQGNTNMAGVFERFTLPQTRSMGLGVNLNF